jgi:hypothetical protein
MNQLKLIALFTLTFSSLTQAGDGIKPRIVIDGQKMKAKFKCSSDMDSVCKILGYEKAISNSKVCKKYGFMGGSCDAVKISPNFKLVTLSLKHSEVVEAVPNFLNGQIPLPGSYTQGRYNIAYATEEVYLIEQLYNSCTQIIKEIACE